MKTYNVRSKEMVRRNQIRKKKKLQKTFSSIALIIVIAIGFIILSSNKETLSHTKISYRDFYVSSGDTLWTIAKSEQKENEYYKGYDVRDIISDIENINLIDSSNLKINQKLTIPTI